MKKIASVSIAFLILSGLFFISCKKNDVKDMKYDITNQNKFLETYVNNKDGKRALWIQVFDQIGNKTVIASYKNPALKIDTYPAKVNENKWVFLLVDDRIEIHLFADAGVKDFQDTDELIKFVKLFDLAGMEKVTGKKLKAEELKKFIPKLGGK